MKKKIAVTVMVVYAVMALTGCGKKEILISDLKDVKVEKYVTLPDYRNMSVTQPQKEEVTDSDVEDFIWEKIDAVSELHEMTGTVENEDMINIDYAGTIDGTAFEGGTKRGALLKIGSGSFIDGFEEGLVGVEVGETKDLFLKFPEDYYVAEMAGKDCVFAVTVNYILTPVSDENVNMVDAGYTSAETYRADAREVLEGLEDYKYELQLKSNIATALIQSCTYEEIPQTLIDDFESRVREDLETSAASAGMSLEQYMAEYNYVEAGSVDNAIDANALYCAKEGLALQAIANQEEFVVSDEELETTLSELASKAGVSSSEEYLTAMNLDKEEARVNLLYNKVYDALVEIYKK